jgi:hypothetical protein
MALDRLPCSGGCIAYIVEQLRTYAAHTRVGNEVFKRGNEVSIMSGVINYAAISTKLTGSKYKLRKNAIPKSYELQVIRIILQEAQNLLVQADQEDGVQVLHKNG